MQVFLTVLEGKPQGFEFPVPGPVFLIGRDARCNLRPHNELVSKLHCAVVQRNQEVFVRDLNSRNGTFVDGVLVTSEVRVADGCRLGVASLVFSFKICPEKVGPAQSSSDLSTGDVEALLNLIQPSDTGVLGAAANTALMRLTDLATEKPPPTRTPA